MIRRSQSFLLLFGLLARLLLFLLVVLLFVVVPLLFLVVGALIELFLLLNNITVLVGAVSDLQSGKIFEEPGTVVGFFGYGVFCEIYFC